MEDIGVIFYVSSFIAGFMSLLTPGGIFFSFFIFGLPILGVFLKEKILIYVSLLIVGVIFFFHFPKCLKLLVKSAQWKSGQKQLFRDSFCFPTFVEIEIATIVCFPPEK